MKNIKKLQCRAMFINHPMFYTLMQPITGETIRNFLEVSFSVFRHSQLQSFTNTAVMTWPKMVPWFDSRYKNELEECWQTRLRR